jgi:tetratricopeptide (TPR) repeat protein
MRLFSLLTIAELLFLAHSQAKPSFVAESAPPAQQTVSTTNRTPTTVPSDRETCLQQGKLPGAHLAVASALNDCGIAAWERGDLANAARYHRQALDIRQRLAPASLDVAESLNHLGDVEEQFGYLENAEQHERKALEIRRKLAPNSLAVAESLHSLGRAAMARGDLARAEADFQAGMDIRQRLAPRGHELAFSFIGMANLCGRRGDFEKQEEYFNRALSLGDQLKPANQAAIFEGLGNLSVQRGQFERAEEYFRKALEIRQTFAAESLLVAISLSDLGSLASNRGDPDEAEQFFRQALEIREKVAPNSLAVANSFSEFGSIAQTRGNLAEAERYFRQALKIEQHFAPEGLAVANSLQQLGVVFWVREDRVPAESYFRRALEIKQRLAPESPSVAQSLNWLGLVYARRGDLAQAEKYFDHALQISKKPSPENLVASQMLTNLGDMAQRRNDSATAENYFQQSLEVHHRLAPNSPGEAGALQKLGDLERKRHNLPEAEKYYRHALAIREKKMPGSLPHANVLMALASELRQQHKFDDSAEMYDQAINVLDNQMSSLGGSEEVRSTFRAKYEVNYKDYIDLLVADVKKPEQAFNVVERSRARTLLELLESGQIDVHNGCSPELLLRERSLRELISAKAGSRIGLLNGVRTEEAVAALDQQIQTLREQYEEVRTEIRLENPGYAALVQPRPLTAKEVQEQLLDGDTVLLEYSLGDRRSYVWALTETNLTVNPLPSRKVIETAARNVYELLTARSRRVKNETDRQRRSRVTESDTEYAKTAAELSQTILGPVAAELGHKRLLIVSDGALQYLPFGALPIPHLPLAKTEANSSSALELTNAPLVAEHEIVNLPSASALAELRRARINRREPAKAVAVFADPVFDRRDDRVAQLHTAADSSQTADARSPARDLSLSVQRLTRSASDVGLIRNGDEYLTRLL